MAVASCKGLVTFLVVLGVALGPAWARSVNAASETVPEYASRHSYKHSLKKPFFLPESNELPHFDLYGDVLPSQEYLRIVPSVSSKRGAVWGDVPLDYENWEIEAEIAVSGRGRLGGDGLAIWLTSQRGTLGPIFGNRDLWDGLGIIFDTYDNDNRRNNPIIMGVLNDGSTSFQYDNDGSGQEFGSCLKNYRNAPVPTRVKILYVKGTLSVYVDVNGRGTDYRLCFTEEGLSLPRGNYIGVTAQTGGLADDHDLMYLEVREVFPDGVPKRLQQEPAAEAPATARQDYQELVDKLDSLNTDPLYAIDDNYKNVWADALGVSQVLDRISDLKRVMEERLAALPAGGAAQSGGAERQPPARDDRDVAIIKSKLEHVEKLLESLLARSEGGGAAVSHDLESRLNNILQRLITIEQITQNSRSMAQGVRDDLKNIGSSGSGGVPMWQLALVMLFIAVSIGAGSFLLGRAGNNASKKFV